MLRFVWPAALLLAVLPAGNGHADSPGKEVVHYLRPTANGFTSECTFTITRDPPGWTIASVTERGAARLTVTARYDSQDRLTTADALLFQQQRKASVSVRAAGGKVTVRRGDGEPQDFTVPAGVIITSAPDWTDTFLLCRRYDRRRGGRQEFAGLWIHPTQAAQRLPFTIERDGTDRVKKDGKALDLERFTIRIRGPNGYVAWVGAGGTMVRLVPLPYREGAPVGLVLKGYEQAAQRLRPPQR